MAVKNYEYVGDGTVGVAFPSGAVVVSTGDVVAIEEADVADREDFKVTKADLKPFTESYPDEPAVGALDVPTVDPSAPEPSAAAATVTFDPPTGDDTKTQE